MLGYKKIMFTLQITICLLCKWQDNESLDSLLSSSVISKGMDGDLKRNLCLSFALSPSHSPLFICPVCATHICLQSCSKCTARTTPTLPSGWPCLPRSARSSELWPINLGQRRTSSWSASVRQEVRTPAATC